jgi:hypothetical protein
MWHGRRGRFKGLQRDSLYVVHDNASLSNCVFTSSCWASEAFRVWLTYAFGPIVKTCFTLF